MPAKKLGFWSTLMNKNEIFDKPAEYTNVLGLSTIPTVRSEPATINLIRAVYDESDLNIKNIDRELSSMDVRKIQLQQDRDAYIEMLAVATKHISLQTETRKRNETRIK